MPDAEIKDGHQALIHGSLLPDDLLEGSAALERLPPDGLRQERDLLTPAHLSEITGMNVQYTRKLCRDGYLPAVQVGESRWHVPKKRFTDYVMGRVDIEADPDE